MSDPGWSVTSVTERTLHQPLLPGAPYEKRGLLSRVLVPLGLQRFNPQSCAVDPDDTDFRPGRGVRAAGGPGAVGDLYAPGATADRFDHGRHFPHQPGGAVVQQRIGGHTGMAPPRPASKIERAKRQQAKDNKLYADGWLKRAEQPHQKSGQP